MATTTDEPETESDGPLTRWVNKAISNPERAYKAMFYVALIFFAVTTLYPFYWLLVLALSSGVLGAEFGVIPLPNGFNPGAFIEVFEVVPFHVYMLNSFVLALLTTAIVIVIASLAGYAFGRLTFPGRGLLMLLILAISYFPPAAFLVPLFDAFVGNAVTIPFTELVVLPADTIRLVNTPGGMVLPFSALFLPLSVFILTTFYGQIPDGLEDAARVEGTTRLGALFRVIMPLSAPGVATAAVLTFIAVYNEYFFSKLMVPGSVAASKWSPLVGGLLRYQTQYTTDFNLIAAASIVGVLPVAILVVVAQERIVSGLTAGALKE